MPKKVKVAERSVSTVQNKVAKASNRILYAVDPKTGFIAPRDLFEKRDF